MNEPLSALKAQNILVTGGGGFIGQAITLALRRMGAQVSVLGRSRYPQLEQQGITCYQGDISTGAGLAHAFSGKTCVFHVAGKAGVWGSARDYMAANAEGTNKVLAACLAANVPVMVQTSTPSVVFDKKSLSGANESLPYAQRPSCAYMASKILAERAVLAANSPRLKTTAVRPHLVWGPGDRNLIPRLLARARAGMLPLVGDGANMVDITYIDNAVLAHLLAAENLLTSATAAGRAFFVGQEAPVKLWPWLFNLFSRLDIAPPTRRVPLGPAYFAGAWCEFFYALKSFFIKAPAEPRITRFTALQLASSHWFSHAEAEKILGYRPLISTDAGLERLIAWLKKTGLTGPS